MWKVRYLQKSGAIVLVLVGTCKSRDSVLGLVKGSDTEFHSIIECRPVVDEVWYIRTTAAN